MIESWLRYRKWLWKRRSKIIALTIITGLASMGLAFILDSVWILAPFFVFAMLVSNPLSQIYYGEPPKDDQ